MSIMDPETRTRYSVQRGRDELSKECWLRRLAWGLIGAACALIVVFAVLLATGTGA
jgi:hypothetical protein